MAGQSMRSRLAALALALLAILNLVRGSIHAFAPDGGAHSIAGLDIAGARQTILSLFATIGLQQIVLGLFEGFVVVVRRDLVTLALALQAGETIAGLANLYFYRTLPVVVPGMPFNIGVLVVVALALLASLSAPRRSAV
jgi:hypothetical protein